jgi:hypothetical protein
MEPYGTDTGLADSPARPTYWLTRFVILRLLGAIYAIAFLVAINQIIPLIGSDGLTPLNIYLKQVSAALGTDGGFIRLPSIFWIWHSDTALITLAWIGFLLSLIVFAGYANGLMLAILWLLYMSFVHVGQEWYGYGWEIMLLETGFLAIFLSPFIDMRPFPKHEPPFQIIVLFRWLIFRIMFGAGLIKLRGDEIWRSATALYYHFETQPIPGPFSRWFHFLPHDFLKIGVWFNWLAELVAPIFTFGPRWGRHVAGVIMILFQFNLVFSGNLSFLNWLTVVPALACLDDGFWSKILPRRLVKIAETAAAKRIPPPKSTQRVTWFVVIVICILSIQPIGNMMSSRQVMNTSFDPLDLVNTYGAFGSVGQQRMNVVFEGTLDDDSTDGAEWKPYVYKGLPVELTKCPPQIAPYHLRFDWQMWFAAMYTPDNYPWTFHLVWKLLHNNKKITGLFSINPFKDQPPKYIRAVLYQYRFTNPEDSQGRWWYREKKGLWMRPMSMHDQELIGVLQSMGWIQ